MPIAPARIAAFDILRKVESGGYASDLLVSHSAGFDSRDAGLASEIVFGVLRYRAQLDYLIDRASDIQKARPGGAHRASHGHLPASLPGARSGARRRSRQRGTGEARAQEFRRRVGQRHPAQGEPRPGGLADPRNGTVVPGVAAGALGAPIRQRRQPTESRVRRCRSRRSIRAEAACRTSARNPSCRCSNWLPARLCSTCAPRPATRPRRRWKRACACIACDLHFHRLAKMRELHADLVVLDGGAPLPFARRFDRILVDAPCSGTGTLGRNPEIKWRLRPHDLADLHGRQTALLATRAAGAGARRTAGLFHLLAGAGGERGSDRSGGSRAGQGDMIRLPGREAGDGFFAAVIKSGEPAND